MRIQALSCPSQAHAIVKPPPRSGLVTVAMAKAMALAPPARYPTARELAEDLRRFQAGQLVGAHRYTLAQRIRRWLARHRAIAAVIAIAATILLGFGAWSLRRIVAERDAAIAQANRAILTQARATLTTQSWCTSRGDRV